mmetsp:Transcript_38237/g.94859  ORF Transcript_38237/g.94859 Transcript_38237/m.94859 type:complete len:84 (-) Transcript_38237:1146-1397(-)
MLWHIVMMMGSLVTIPYFTYYADGDDLHQIISISELRMFELDNAALSPPSISLLRTSNTSTQNLNQSTTVISSCSSAAGAPQT